MGNDNSATQAAVKEPCNADAQNIEQIKEDLETETKRELHEVEDDGSGIGAEALTKTLEDKLQRTLEFIINERNELQREVEYKNSRIRILNGEIAQLEYFTKLSQNKGEVKQDQEGIETKCEVHEVKYDGSGKSAEALKKAVIFGENKGEVLDGQNKEKVEQNYKGIETKREFHEVQNDASGKSAEALKKTLAFGENKEEVPDEQHKEEVKQNYERTETKQKFQEVKDEGSSENGEVLKKCFAFGETKGEALENHNKNDTDPLVGHLTQPEDVLVTKKSAGAEQVEIVKRNSDNISTNQDSFGNAVNEVNVTKGVVPTKPFEAKEEAPVNKTLAIKGRSRSRWLVVACVMVVLGMLLLPSSKSI